MRSNPNWKPKKLLLYQGKPITGLLQRKNGDVWRVKDGILIKFEVNTKLK